jgi:hypothetical protein
VNTPGTPDSTRTRRRRRLRVAVGGVVLAGSTLVGALAPAPASAATGTWEINNFRHFCGLGQEAGSDEIYLVNIWFKFQPGDANTVQVGRTSIYEMGSIDDEEYHSIKPDMGQAKFTGLHDFGLNLWSGDQLLHNPGPEIVGTITQVMEADRASNSDRGKVADGLVNGLREQLRSVASLTGPVQVIGTAASNALGDALAGNNMNEERANALKTFLVGAVAKTALDTVNSAGFWSSLRTLRDDWIGSPKLSIFVSADSFVGSLIEPTAAQVNEGGHIFGTLQNRSWKTTYKGDGARYVMDVHTGRVS